MAPFAPHTSEEIWSILGEDFSVHQQNWPEYDINSIKQDIYDLIIQVNGKVRGKIEIPSGASKTDVFAMARLNKNVGSHILNKNIVKEIYIPDRLINFVVK